ncbi:hypothetical protein [Lysinibacillus sp. FSL W8-0953]|uniref:hypothetical protein n=1 Tax=Lysinibacillus sp. FSL W8-0953 TaxID=2954640 RepID=UPI0030FCE566
MKQGDMTILAQNVALEALDKLRKNYPEYRFSTSGTHSEFTVFVERMTVTKSCNECVGRLMESGDIRVLADGYEAPIYKCEKCGKEN